MAIISISRQIGSLGDEIAKLAADQLGYELIEKSQISEILAKHGFSASDVDKYDEKKPSLLQTLSIQKKIFAHLIRTAVYELAAKENVMIVGRGAQVILKDIPGTLHVRVIAPYAARVGRLMEQMGYENKKAQWLIRQSDRDSSGYIRTYFDASWDDSDLYDLVINTRTMTMSSGVEMILSAVGTDEFRKSPQVSEKLIDLALTQKVKAVLLEVAGVEVVNLEVQKGAVNMIGSAISIEAKEECEKAISNIRGIAEVNNQLNVMPETIKRY
jgi:cytidylate kinase